MIGNYQINAQTLAHVNWQSFDGAIVPGKKLLSNQENVSLKFFGYVENNEPNIEAILKEVAVLFAVRDISGALRLEEILNDSDKGHLSNILPKRYLKSFPVLITEELKGSKLLERVVKIARDQTEQMISSIFKQVMITLNGCHEKGILIRSLSANSIVSSYNHKTE